MLSWGIYVCIIHGLSNVQLESTGKRLPTDLTESVGRLDLALSSIRRFWNRKSMRSKLLEELAETSGGLTIYRVLRAIETSPSREPSITDVAEALKIEHSTASRFVDRAVEREVVIRESSASDRRRTRLRITEDGMHLLARLKSIRVGILAESVSEWPRQDLDQLVILLERLIVDSDMRGLE